MNIEDFTLEEFIQRTMDFENNPKIQNEWLPMREFELQINKITEKQLLKIEENKNDPPDYILHFEDGITIGCEVTTLIDKQEQKHQEFYKLVESIFEPILEKHKTLLPKGSYFCNYSPGSENNIKGGNFTIDSFDHKYNISKNDLHKYISGEFPKFLKNYNEKKSTFLILNTKGEQVGRIRVSKMFSSDETNIVTYPQGIYRMNWTIKDFVVKIQEIIDEKNNDYKNHQNWLLISDINTSITTQLLSFTGKESKFTTNFFDRVFIIQYFHSDYNIIELEIE